MIMLEIIVETERIVTKQNRPKIQCREGTWVMTKELFSSVEQFYNTVSKDYNKFVHRAVPRYPEMLWAIFTKNCLKGSKR